MKLESYGWRTCSKEPRPSYRCCQQARPSTSFVDNTIDWSWRNFLGPGSLRQSSEGGVPLFWRNSNFLISQRKKNWKRLLAKTCSILPLFPIQYWLVTDRRTHDDSMYRASIASRRKNRLRSVKSRHHGLCGIASPVLTATGFVNGIWQFSTPTESTPLDRSPKN